MVAEFQITLKIVLNALHSSKMRLSRIMHIQADLLNGVCYIWTGEGEILQSTNNTAILCGVGHRSTISRQLGVSINGRTARLAVTHTCPIQNIQRILQLCEKQTIISTLN
jgi:hypothetical protein